MIPIIKERSSSFDEGGLSELIDFLNFTGSSLDEEKIHETIVNNKMLVARVNELIGNIDIVQETRSLMSIAELSVYLQYKPELIKLCQFDIKVITNSLVSLIKEEVDESGEMVSFYIGAMNIIPTIYQLLNGNEKNKFSREIIELILDKFVLADLRNNLIGFVPDISTSTEEANDILTQIQVGQYGVSKRLILAARKRIAKNILQPEQNGS